LHSVFLAFLFFLGMQDIEFYPTPFPLEFPIQAEVRSTNPALRVSPKVRLGDLTLQELIGQTDPVVDEGTYYLGNSGFSPVETLQAVRSVDGIWSYRYDSTLGVAVQVDYQVVGIDGTPGVLSNELDPQSRISIQVEGTGPFVVHQNKRWTRIEGGALFYLTFEEAARAGGYEGTLWVTVNHF
jgi:hypothetical protein